MTGLDGHDDVVMAALLSAARVFATVTAESIAQVGDEVTLPQLRVLVLASGVQPVSASEVAQALDIHQSSASRLCDRLVRAGLLDRREHPDDRRLVQLRTTEEGARLLAGVVDHRRAVFATLLERLDPEQRDSLAAALTLFSAVADEVDHRLRLIP